MKPANIFTLSLLLTLLLVACGRDNNSPEAAADTQAKSEQHQAAEDHDDRVRIPADVAAASKLVTEIAGPAKLVETLILYGQIATNAEHQREVAARFPGLIKSVRRSIGDTVKAGETLAVIESNLSLEPVALTAPMAGVITARDANPGEQSGERMLFTITDPASVWAELSVFPRDRARVRPGAVVRVRAADGGDAITGSVSRIGLEAGGNQAVTARVVLDNRSGAFPPGTFVTADVEVGSIDVPLAVKTSGLQQYREASVVFEQIGDQYQARPLALGRRHGKWVEVLDGLEPGAIYVSGNSYLIKADIEKSGAAHDH
ncbi:efflux RND transporter periplasmic adaptor subunit [uncultured Nevskia sp.]|uniref:efflux RND transporter periplasmic adaptor subunit n=1 Tax=uncultured Nevskia sp. TaxID=228950 RepID=UPI0025E2F15F|nr:efflux RND transporter periplasmic adaptor subunit [uncultured Nevskia sp.]